MDYSEQLPEQLTERGFVFAYNHTDEDISYDVYSTPHLQVTLDHTNKEVVINITLDDETVNIQSISHFDKVVSVIKSITQ